MTRSPFAASLSRRRALALLGGLALPSLVRAQADWPSKPLKFVVPFTPGGSTDILARVLGQKLEPVLRQPVIVENRPGAGGTIASAAVAKAEPDGTTFMMGHIGTLAFNPSLYPNLPYNAQTDFAPVAFVATVPNILVVHPDLPAKDVQAFIAHAKANPGKLSYGSGGNGSAAHIAGAYFSHAAGIQTVHVPYRGTAPMITDLLSGTIQFTLTGGPAVLPHVAAGKLRALAVSSRDRAPFAPDLPTLTASGLADFEAVQWYGLVAPAGTPKAIVERLNRAINALMDAPEIARTLANDGALAAPRSAEDFGKLIGSEIALWRTVIQQAGIKVE